MHSVVTGRAFKRAMPIFSPQDSQTPYSPSSSRSRASWILKMSFRSRSRIRRVKSRLDSREERSVGSGKFSSSSIPSTVLPASERRSRMRRFRRRRKKITSFWVTKPRIGLGSTLYLITLKRCHVKSSLVRRESMHRPHALFRVEGGAGVGEKKDFRGLGQHRAA